MRIAVVAAEDPSSPATWSGIPRSAIDALRGLGVEILPIGPLRWPWRKVFYLGWRYSTGVRKRAYRPELEERVVRSFARSVEAAVEGRGVDAILSTTTLPLATLGADIPLYTWLDATFASLRGYYQEYTGLSRRMQTQGDSVDARALAKVRHAFFASDWAAHTAREHYGMPGERLTVAPFGANLVPSVGGESVRASITGRSDDLGRRMVWIGSDWERKGGDLALSVHQHLVTDRDVHLHLVGASPPARVALPRNVTHEGYLSRDQPAERRRFQEVLSAAHLHLLPSRAECFGIAAAEAAAFGVPTLGTETGGLPEACGVAGRALDRASDAATWARAARGMLDEFATLGPQARADFEDRLNWRASARLIQRQIVADVG